MNHLPPPSEPELSRPEQSPSREERMENLSYVPQIQHFSHPHTLQLSNLQDNPQLQQATSLSVCSACQHQLSSGGAWIYSCPPCGFAVHASCAQLYPLIAHPSHPMHPLSLLPSPAYPSGFFLCNACGHAGSGCSYHCAECHYDLHVACAHLDRATGAPSPPQPRSQLQHYNSFLGATNSHWHHYPNQTAPAVMGPTTQPGLPNHIMHSYSMGAVPNSQRPLPPPPLAAAGGIPNSVMGSAILIIVNSFAGQVAQAVLQLLLSSITGENDNGNDGSGYDG